MTKPETPSLSRLTQNYRASTSEKVCRKLSEEYYDYRVRQESARQVERTSRTLVLSTIEQYKTQLEALRAKDHLNVQLISSLHNQLQSLEQQTGVKAPVPELCATPPAKLFQISTEIENDYQLLELREKLRIAELKASDENTEAKAMMDKLMKRLVEEKQRADKAVQAAKRALDYVREKVKNGHPGPEAPIGATPPPPNRTQPRDGEINVKFKALKESLNGLKQFIEAVAQKMPILLVKTVKDGLIRSPIFNHSLIQDLSSKYLQELFERRRLFNQLQEIQGNIRVICRVRPLQGGQTCISVRDECVLTINDVKLGLSRDWEFDKVLGMQATQENVFDSVQPLIQSVIDGYNVCIFAYGQTGAGKTFTMEGPSSNPGINARTSSHLFSLIDSRRPSWQYTVHCSVLEVYNDRVRDLLAPGNSAFLKVKRGEGGLTHVPEAEVVRVADSTEMMLLLDSAATQRAIGQTNVNLHSSRSHLILTMYVKGRCEGVETNSKLHLIDLAGSERVGKSGSEGDRLKEAQHINKSLFALGDVLTARRTKQSHVPFRNSTLTFFLQDSLSGDSKTLMILQVNPDASFYDESNCSLQFASKARSTELGPAKRKIVPLQPI